MQRALKRQLYFLLKVITLTGALTYLVVSLVYLEKLPDGLSVPNDSSVPLHERIAIDEFEYRGKKVRLMARLRDRRWFEEGTSDVTGLILADGYELKVHLQQPLNTGLGPGELELGVIGTVLMVSRGWGGRPDALVTTIILEDAVFEIKE